MWCDSSLKDPTPSHHCLQRHSPNDPSWPIDDIVMDLVWSGSPYASWNKILPLGLHMAWKHIRQNPQTKSNFKSNRLSMEIKCPIINVTSKTPSFHHFHQRFEQQTIPKKQQRRCNSAKSPGEGILNPSCSHDLSFRISTHQIPSDILANVVIKSRGRVMHTVQYIISV